MSRGPGDRGGRGGGRGLWGGLPRWALACLVIGTALFVAALVLSIDWNPSSEVERPPVPVVGTMQPPNATAGGATTVPSSVPSR